MKFLILTDLHNQCSAFEWIERLETDDVDAILFLGDVTDFGTSEEGVNTLKRFKKDVYFIPGNCDPLDLPTKAESVCHSVHGKAFSIGDIKFAAYGGSNPTIFHTPFEIEEDIIESDLDKICEGIDILMTHAPSNGILDEIPSGLHVGSTAIKKIVERYKPKVALSGHIHEAIGILKINDTLFINPGPAKEGHAAILELNGDVINAKLVESSDLL